jgi:hypothetical protein
VLQPYSKTFILYSFSFSGLAALTAQTGAFATDGVEPVVLVIVVLE